MIEAIHYLGITVAILVNLTALTLIVFRYLPYPATARVVGIHAVCLALFTLEHFVGLGRLYPLYIPLTLFSLYVIWREQALYEAIGASQIVFVCALAYGALWRIASPEIRDDGDRIPDFHFVSNYFAGEKLLPLDFWLPHQKLDYYYTFQHYAAALLGRIFGLSPGVSFNFASVLLISLVLTLTWEFSRWSRVRFALKLLTIAALAIGGRPVIFFRFQAYPGIDGTGFSRENPSNGRMLGYLEDAPPRIVLEKIYEESPWTPASMRPWPRSRAWLVFPICSMSGKGDGPSFPPRHRG